MDISNGTPPGPLIQAQQSDAQAEGGGRGTDGNPSARIGGKGGDALHPRLQAVLAVGRHHGIELDPAEYRNVDNMADPSAPSLSAWVQAAGLWARAVRLRWRNVVGFQDTSPIVLLLNDGSAALLTGANAEQNVIYLKDPQAPESAVPVAVDELRLSEVWKGEALLVRANRGIAEADAPFSVRWLVGLVMTERSTLRDVCIASLALSLLTIGPPLLVMSVVNRVMVYHSMSTLALLAILVVVLVGYETLLGYARRLLIAVLAIRVDTKLSLHIFNRLLRLPIDYFERNPAGDTLHRLYAVNQVREFITGRLLMTFLDFITLAVILPILFYLSSTLTWLVIACACVLAIVILVFLRPVTIATGRVIQAEINKAAVMTETVFGIRTVKSLALEPQRKALWDERVADAAKFRMRQAVISNWPQTIATPIERFMWMGVMLVGAYMAMSDSSGYMVGSLFAFLMLSQRVAQPLVGAAGLTEKYLEVKTSIGLAAQVLNRPMEGNPASGGLRPRFAGAISFEDVTFTYPGGQSPALNGVTFAIPAGTMLGVVGRSGSGKSTITRLLQGINREYSGFIKLDGSDLREINLRHLRQSFGVVLQDNFLFRGSIRDNIIAGRPGFTIEDVVRAARLAGAEEFIERLPHGYETYIEEGSPNLSGGQRQRLAIARAVITDPRLLILDEATSALDPESEALVNANLQRIARGRTMVIVSHRLSSLTECDQTLVLERGAVVDIAPHHVLLERCAIYRSLWAQQNRHLDKQGPRHAAIAPSLAQGD
ncbi:MAG TPA: peptidase domain-containing ABC transporter [Acetobacteraceae bacterium]|nr:peptidase domain-containing ABC transporter [Acetobacteraceae bacterium]